MTDLVRQILVILVRILVGARGEWIGSAPETRSRIYFANHTSHFDTLAIISALPLGVRRRTHPVAARDYWGSSAFRRFIAEGALRAVLIDRDGSGGGDPLAPVHAVLDRRDSVLIFPEGTRGAGEEIAPFRSGLHRLAEAYPDAELIPVHLENLARVMPKGSFLIVPITCTARFGAPLTQIPGEPKAAFLERARAAVAGLARPRNGGAA
ncbi:lysophospholipid acyltransferase family protein [Methylopila henanensis]|uniref:Lysophospholipid acyltransferase family protein n=1 Tax=Methylopila henanensis TaxID=873516 RepID=A0ABW4KAH1_9HYPH